MFQAVLTMPFALTFVIEVSGPLTNVLVAAYAVCDKSSHSPVECMYGGLPLYVCGTIGP